MSVTSILNDAINKINYRIISIIVLVFLTTSCNNQKKVIQGHSHNDYEQQYPLHEALRNGFVSVEADVHLVGDMLYVSHNYPKSLDTMKTLENLYLKPLKEHIKKNNGFVYKDYSDDFYLMIDFKSDAKPSYNKLKSILQSYKTMIYNEENPNAPVKIFISGNRPIDEILNDYPKLMLLDGRPNDIARNIPTSVMPVISDNYNNILSWSGSGNIDENELKEFKLLVEQIHKQNKKLRLWASPDKKIIWKFLLENDVDLINTDRLKEFSEFILEYQK